MRSDDNDSAGEWRRIGERFHALTLQDVDFDLTVYRLEHSNPPIPHSKEIPRLIASEAKGRFSATLCDGDSWRPVDGGGWTQWLIKPNLHAVQADRFLSIARDAGRRAIGLPNSIADLIWQDHPRPLSGADAVAVWMNVILMGVSNEASEIPVESVSFFRPMADLPPEFWLTHRTTIPRPRFAPGAERPPFWFAKIDGVAALSVRVGEWIAGQFAKPATEKADKNADNSNPWKIKSLPDDPHVIGAANYVKATNGSPGSRIEKVREYLRKNNLPLHLADSIDKQLYRYRGPLGLSQK